MSGWTEKLLTSHSSFLVVSCGITAATTAGALTRTPNPPDTGATPCPRPSVSTSAPPTRSSPSSRPATPSSSPTPRASARRPSVVAFAKNGEVLVGEVAKRQAITNPDRTIRSVKRHMGTNWTIDIDGKAYTSQEISARTLHEAQARRRGLPRRHRHPGRHHRARPTSTTPSAPPPRRPARSPASRCCASSTSPPRPRSPTASTRRARTRRSSCSTSAAAPSTCRCSRSATACSR